MMAKGKGQLPSGATLALLLVFAAAAPGARAHAWGPGDYPNPETDPAACRRSEVATGRSHVCDADGMLSAKSRDVLEGIIQDVEAGRHPYVLMQCGSKGNEGFKVAIAVMRRMQVAPGGDEGHTAQTFAKQLHDEWGVGDKACNNGVLLLLAVENRQVYISTGAGALKALPDSKVQTILARMRPQLRAANYDRAVEQAVVDIGLGLAGADFDDDNGSSWFDPVIVCILGLIGGCFAVSWWNGRKKRREASTCKRLLQKLKEEQQTAMRTNRYQTTSCPICMDDFAPDSACGGSQGGSSRASGGSDDGAPSAPLLKATKVQSGSGGGDSAAPSAPPLPASMGGNDPPVLRRPLALPCGHRFCEPCISQWVDINSSTTCPVCRKSIRDDDDGGAGPSQAPLRSNADGAQEQAQGGYRDLFMDDFAFRLGILQNRYPWYISDDLRTRWTTEARQGQTFSGWEGVRQQQMVEARQAHAHACHSGASTSFGGGSSFGGGGCGASW